MLTQKKIEQLANSMGVQTVTVLYILGRIKNLSIDEANMRLKIYSSEWDLNSSSLRAIKEGISFLSN